MRTKQKSTAEKLGMFRQKMREHFTAKLNGNTIPKPSSDEFRPEFRRFAEAIAGEELAVYTKAFNEKRP